MSDITNDQALSRMSELVPILKRAAEAYYAHDEEIMSNYEYDRIAFNAAGGGTIRLKHCNLSNIPKKGAQKQATAKWSQKIEDVVMQD